MADEEREEAAAEEKKGGGLAKILLMAIGIVLALILSASIAFVVAKKTKPPEQEFGPEPVHEEPLPPKPYHIQELDEFVVKLADPGTPRYIRAKITLAYGEEKFLPAELGERIRQIRDIINTILMGKTTDVATPEGKQALKREIVKKINAILREGKIKDAYIELVVQ